MRRWQRSAIVLDLGAYEQQAASRRRPSMEGRVAVCKGLRKFALLIIGIFVAGFPEDSLPSSIIHVTLVDGTGAPPQPDMTVVVRGDRIAQVGKAGQKKRECFT
jgi:hypothetical protein